MTNPSPNPREELKAFLRDNLRIEVKKTSEHTGGQFDGPLYSDCYTIQLILDGEIISEASL